MINKIDYFIRDIIAVRIGFPFYLPLNISLILFITLLSFNILKKFEFINKVSGRSVLFL